MRHDGVDPEDDLPMHVTIAPEGFESRASGLSGVRVQVDDGAAGYGPADLDLGPGARVVFTVKASEVAIYRT